MHSQLLRKQAMKPWARRNPESEGYLLYGDLIHHRLEVIYNREGQRWSSTPASPWAFWLLVPASALVPSLHLRPRGVVWSSSEGTEIIWEWIPRLGIPLIAQSRVHPEQATWGHVHFGDKGTVPGNEEVGSWKVLWLKEIVCVFETEGEESSDSDISSEQREQRQTGWITES